MAKKEKEPVKTLHELMVMNPSLKASLIQFESAKVQSDSIAKQCMLIKVTDSDSLAVCENNLAKANDLCSAVEDIRLREVKEPWNKFKTINAAAAYISGGLDSAVEYLKTEKKNYILKEEAEKKRLEGLQAKVDAMTEKMKTSFESIENVTELDAFVVKMNGINFVKQYEDYSEQAKTIADGYHKLFAIKRIELEALLTATPEAAEEIKEEAEKAKELVQEIVTEAKIDYAPAFETTIKKVRRPWKFEVVDAAKVPKEWLMIDEDKVNEWKKANQDNLVDGQIINGIKFYKDLTITA